MRTLWRRIRDWFVYKRGRVHQMKGRMSMRKGSRGFTLVELMVALGVLVVSLIGLISVITYTTTQNEINRENMLAMRVAEGKIEEMRQYVVPEIFARYSCTSWGQAQPLYPAGTPQPPGIFPGADFTASVAADPTYAKLRNVQATVTFPWVNGAAFVQGLWTPNSPIVLLEDQTDKDPINRDLNANGAVDDPTLNYVLLPTTITVNWTGIRGKRSITYKYLFYKRS
jgi:type II secretion system protein I